LSLEIDMIVLEILPLSVIRVALACDCIRADPRHPRFAPALLVFW